MVVIEAGDLRVGVDRRSGALHASERAEVGHRASAVEERVIFVFTRFGNADDLSPTSDAIGLAVRSAEDTEVSDRVGLCGCGDRCEDRDREE